MYKKVAILGSGSWATALAKMVMHNQAEINWFIRRQEVIDEFIATGKNPTYLGMASFDVGRIHFSSDINQTVAQSDVLILAIPSPYIKKTLNKIRRDMRHKIVINAVKGMMPDENILFSLFLFSASLIIIFFLCLCLFCISKFLTSLLFLFILII